MLNARFAQNFQCPFIRPSQTIGCCKVRRGELAAIRLTSGARARTKCSLAFARADGPTPRRDQTQKQQKLVLIKNVMVVWPCFYIFNRMFITKII